MKSEIIGAFPAPAGIHFAVELHESDGSRPRWAVGYWKYSSWTYEQRRDLVEWVLQLDDRVPEDLTEPLF